MTLKSICEFGLALRILAKEGNAQLRENIDLEKLLDDYSIMDT